MIRHHDEKWRVPVHNDRHLFECLIWKRRKPA
jgi:3-methyladenine DNA glycosylase Tag